MDKIKRERGANFSLQERDILISLVQKYKSVIENKQSDATSWKKKDTAWDSIEKDFNARSGGIYRSSKTLRIKYEGLKRLVRKKSAIIRSELYRTGGGKNIAVPLDSVEEQIKNMISLSTDGLESIYDSDVLPLLPTQTQENQASKKSSFDELTQAKLELVQLQKSLLESEIIEKKKEWEEKKKEREFKEMERKWKEEEYKLKLEKLRRELKD